MAKRSLQASLTGIQLAKRSFALKGWTQENLAFEVNIKTRQPIWRFFTGKPVDRQIFLEICSVLDLDWHQIAGDPPIAFPNLSNIVESTSSKNIERLVEQVRYQVHDTINNQCGIVQPLNMGRPINLKDIYVETNVYEEITSQRWVDISDLQGSESNKTKFNMIEKGNNQRMSGCQAVKKYYKVRVLGRPGSGKTVFLQNLGFQCNQGHLFADRVPVLIALKDFAEEFMSSNRPSLLKYICQKLLVSDVTQSSDIEKLLQAGKLLLLIDGVDEVLDRYSTEILREVQRFSENYHRNYYVMSCRSGAQNIQIRGFTDIEISPLTLDQMQELVHKYLTVLNIQGIRCREKDAENFIKNLRQPENLHYQDLLVNPLFLHLACWIFHCQGKLPSRPMDLYKQALDLLLIDWDKARGVMRDSSQRNLSLPQKIRLLGLIAERVLKKGQYYFEKQDIEQHIIDYLQNLPGVSLEPDELQVESKAVLKRIEIHHGLLTECARGIFCFSNLAFLKHFAAKEIITDYEQLTLD